MSIRYFSRLSAKDVKVQAVKQNAVEQVRMHHPGLLFSRSSQVFRDSEKNWMLGEIHLQLSAPIEVKRTTKCGPQGPVASPYINLLQLLQDVLGIAPLGASHPEEDATPPASMDSFDELLQRYRDRLSQAIRDAVVSQNTAQATRRYHGGYPLLSCFVNDCLARGKDIDHGGARYNWIEPSFVGLANLVDSLAAIRKFVFEEHTLSLDELIAALKTDFEGAEVLRLELLNRAPKYGNDDDEVDHLAKIVTRWIAEECSRHRTYLGGTFHPGLFCWVKHEALGRTTAASADGRRSGFPLADGSGAAQGRERLGPTAAVKSITKWDHSPFLGGIAVNLKFSPGRDKETFIGAMQNLLETFMRLGGFEVQVNVVDRDTLIDAKAHPEEYRDLVVRVAGYSDYFVGLTEKVQDEIIMRTEH